MDDTAIKLENVSKHYKLYDNPKDRLKEALHPFGKKLHKKFYALNNINLEVKRGEILGIIGKNGSGKSTLLKTIAGVLMPNSGSIRVNGRISALLELGAGFNPDFTGLDNLYFYGTILGLTRAYIDEKIDDILAFADIGEFINQPLKTYSSGMKARLGFAIATEINPDILIIDEVLSVGDALFQRRCYARIETFLKDGKTVLLVSHNRNSIISLCDNAVLINEGKIYASGEAEHTMRAYENLISEKFIKKNPKSSKVISEKALSESSSNESNYDDALMSEPVYLQSSKVTMEEFYISNLNNEKVNILKTGQRYNVSAVFKFQEDLCDLTFALRIKSLQGIVVSWIGYPFKKRAFFNAKAGELKSIKLSFECNLLYGTYVTDVGLQSMHNNDLKVHIGCHDLYMFRINATNDNYFGIAHLNFSEADE